MPIKKIEASPQASSEPKTQSINGSKSNGATITDQPNRKANLPPIGKNPAGIPDWRLEQLPFRVENDWADGEYRYRVIGDTKAPAPPMRPSKYLSKEQS